MTTSDPKKSGLRSAQVILGCATEPWARFAYPGSLSYDDSTMLNFISCKERRKLNLKSPKHHK